MCMFSWVFRHEIVQEQLVIYKDSSVPLLFHWTTQTPQHNNVDISYSTRWRYCAIITPLLVTTMYFPRAVFTSINRFISSGLCRCHVGVVVHCPQIKQHFPKHPDRMISQPFPGKKHNFSYFFHEVNTDLLETWKKLQIPKSRHFDR